MTLEEKLNLVVNDLKSYAPGKIILFGSAIRGDMDRYSDLDIVVIEETKKSVAIWDKIAKHWQGPLYSMSCNTGHS